MTYRIHYFLKFLDIYIGCAMCYCKDKLVIDIPCDHSPYRLPKSSIHSFAFLLTGHTTTLVMSRDCCDSRDTQTYINCHRKYMHLCMSHALHHIDSRMLDPCQNSLYYTWWHQWPTSRRRWLCPFYLSEYLQPRGNYQHGSISLTLLPSSFKFDGNFVLFSRRL